MASFDCLIHITFRKPQRNTIFLKNYIQLILFFIYLYCKKILLRQQKYLLMYR